MKKRDLVALTMVCLSAALLIGACQQQPTGGQGPAAMEGQQSFTTVLNADALKKFNEMDGRGKQMAVDKANQGTDPNTAVNDAYNQWKQGGGQSYSGRPPAPSSRPVPPSNGNRSY